MANVQVALPPQPQDPSVALPDPPAAPPTSADIIRAMKFLRDVTSSHDQRPMGQKSSDQDLAAAEIYKHTILQRASEAAAPQQAVPAWFLPAMEAAMPQILEAAIPQIMARILAPVTASVMRLTNQFRDDGQVIPFVVVPFIDGENPTGLGLPALSSFQIIDTLNPQQVTAYLNGYNIPIPVGPNADHLSKDMLKRTVSGQS